MPGLCGEWCYYVGIEWAVAVRYFKFCVMRVMSFVMEEDVSQFIVCKCVVGSVVFRFCGDVVDDLDG